jgi:hypothetical protein
VFSAKRVLGTDFPRIHSLPEQIRSCQEQKEVNLGESLMKLTLCRWPLTPIDNATPDRPKPRTTPDESNAGSNAQRSMRLVMHQAARTEAGSRFLEGLEGVRSSTLKQAQVFSVRLTRLYILSRFQNCTVTGLGSAPKNADVLAPAELHLHGCTERTPLASRWLHRCEQSTVLHVLTCGSRQTSLSSLIGLLLYRDCAG